MFYATTTLRMVLKFIGRGDQKWVMNVEAAF